MLIYIQEVVWIEDQGEGTPLSCRTSHTLELLLAFHYDWENETILPGALRHFKWYQNMYSYFFVHITLHRFSVNSRWWGEGGRWWDRQYRVWTTRCVASWMLLLHMQEIVPVAFCPLEGGGGGGADILAPGLQTEARTNNECLYCHCSRILRILKVLHWTRPG